MSRANRRSWVSTLPHTLALLGLVIIVLVVFNLLLQGSRARETPVSSAALSQAATDRLIERLQDRLRTYPAHQEAYVQLGGAYLQKARETGDPSYYARAEEALRKALDLEPASLSAMNLMGTLTLGRHQFQEALEWAGRALQLDPESASAYGVRGDAQMELGQYESGIQSYQSMVDLKPDLGSYARVSYARELMGDVDGAVEAMKMAVAAGAPGAESTAWALVELGNLYFNSGRIDEAAEQYTAALKGFGGYHVALAALGKARAAQGQYGEAIRLYEGAAAVVPQPATLAALGDLYARTGDMDKAQLQYDTVELIARLAEVNQVIYNRELALFYADHDLKLGEALGLAARELSVRKDIYGYDTLAWALYKNHRLDEAAQAIAQAMKLGTQDPVLYYHAGMIHYRLGDSQRAQEYLEHALSLNPRFSIRYADAAARTLARLRGQTDGSGNPGGTAQ